jgi:hypothetical protein
MTCQQNKKFNSEKMVGVAALRFEFFSTVAEFSGVVEELWNENWFLAFLAGFNADL